MGIAQPQPSPAKVFELTDQTRAQYVGAYVARTCEQLRQSKPPLADTTRRLRHSFEFVKANPELGKRDFYVLGTYFLTRHAWQLGEAAGTMLGHMARSAGLELDDFKDAAQRYVSRDILLSGDSIAFFAERLEDCTILDPRLGVLRPTGRTRDLFSRRLETLDNQRHFKALAAEVKDGHQRSSQRHPFAMHLLIKRSLNGF